ncbi:MAG: type II toxin-antitoxin system RelE/ParE family toxin [Gemmatimonadota bacterium]
MVELDKHEQFQAWFAELRDPTVRQRILTRLRRLSLGNPGDARSVGGGVVELRIDWGPGYRVYFIRRGARLIILLGGGTKSTQERDIRDAQALARQL